jgi:hypothetical protein
MHGLTKNTILVTSKHHGVGYESCALFYEITAIIGSGSRLGPGLIARLECPDRRGILTSISVLE